MEKTLDIAKLEADIAKLIAESMKLHAETCKMNRERAWYPVVVGAAVATAFIAFAKLFV